MIGQLARGSCAACCALVLAACGGGDPAGLPGDADDRQPFSQVPEDAAIRFTGTEPFWGGRVSGGVLTWSTPDDIDGVEIPVTRFAGRGGLSFSGELGGESFDLAITPGSCSDGMSDRRYNYVATASIGGAVREGCAWIEGAEPAGVN
jgi:uncharacterized membrane protein